jgi:hypothetical protein
MTLYDAHCVCAGGVFRTSRCRIHAMRVLERIADGAFASVLTEGNRIPCEDF